MIVFMHFRVIMGTRLLAVTQGGAGVGPIQVRHAPLSYLAHHELESVILSSLSFLLLL